MPAYFLKHHRKAGIGIEGICGTETCHGGGWTSGAISQGRFRRRWNYFANLAQRYQRAVFISTICILSATGSNPVIYRKYAMGLYWNGHRAPKTHVTNFYPGLSATFRTCKSFWFFNFTSGLMRQHFPVWSVHFDNIDEEVELGSYFLIMVIQTSSDRCVHDIGNKGKNIILFLDHHSAIILRNFYSAFVM